MHTTLDWVTLGIWVVVILVFVYGIISIHDIPHSIAVKRNHPHADAIEATGWVSLFMMHALWPFLWIWAYYYKPRLSKAPKFFDRKMNFRIYSKNLILCGVQLFFKGSKTGQKVGKFQLNGIFFQIL